MLCSIVSRSQLFGGPERSAITAGLFQSIALIRILVLMDQTKRMAELVQDHLPRFRIADARIEPPEVHRRLVLGTFLQVVPITDQEPSN